MGTLPSMSSSSISFQKLLGCHFPGGSFQKVLGHHFPACPWPWLCAGPSCVPCAAPQPDPALLTPINSCSHGKATLSHSHLADTGQGGDPGTTFSQSHLHKSMKGPFPFLPMHGSDVSWLLHFPHHSSQCLCSHLKPTPSFSVLH